MYNSPKIKDYLDKLKGQHDASGAEAIIFFVESEFGQEYVIKKYVDDRGFPGTYQTKESFQRTIINLNKEVRRLRKKGVDLARIYDYTFSEDSNGRKIFMEIQDRLPGCPIYVLKWENLEKGLDFRIFTGLSIPAQEELKDEISLEMQKHNVLQQEMLLDARDSAFKQFANDLYHLYVEPNSISLDTFCENLLYEENLQKFSIIDLDYKRFDDCCSTEEMAIRMLSWLSLSKKDISRMGIDSKLKEEMIKNNLLIQMKAIDVLGKGDFVTIKGDADKQKILQKVSNEIDKYSGMDGKMCIRTKEIFNRRIEDEKRCCKGSGLSK